MKKFIKANFSRLLKNKIFLICMLASLGVGMFVPALVPSDAVRNLSLQFGIYSGGEMTFDNYFFVYVIVIAVIGVVFSAYFVGVEHHDGTLRNKIVSGGSRNSIYVSYLSVNAIACWLFYTAYMLGDVLVGSFVLGKFQRFSAGEVFVYIICIYVLMVAMAGIATMFAMLISERTISLCVSLGVIIFLIFYASDLSASLANEQYRDDDWYMNGVLIPAGAENPLYIGGLKRAVYLFLMDFLPSGQLMQFYDLSWQNLNRNPVVMLFGSLVFAVGTTVVGMILFRKKNLK